MARFIHLNGPPGIGKSAIAKVYADRHPGVLNLDIDQVAAPIGGWQDMFGDAFEAGRLLAAGMARTHLAGGRDVVMPQLITNQREITDFEAAVTEARAEYCHIVLMADVESSLARFSRRTEAGDEHDILISKLVEEMVDRSCCARFIRRTMIFLAAVRGDPGVAGRARDSLDHGRGLQSRERAALVATLGATRMNNLPMIWTRLDDWQRRARGHVLI